MSRQNDTERMRPADATDPSAPPVAPDPGDAPPQSKRVTTQPFPIHIPIAAAPTEPEARPLVDRRNATDPDIDPLLKAFDRTPVPPAPMPDERASSDGGDFVAHYAMTKPAASNQPRSEDARAVVQRELRHLIAEPSSEDREGALVAPLDVSTEVPLARQLRRRRGALIVACVSLVAAIILIAAAASRTAPTDPVVATSATATAPAAPTTVNAPPIATSGATPSAIVLPPPVSPSTTTIPAAAIPSVAPAAPRPKPSARPTQTSKPSNPDDEFEYVLPR